MSNLDKVRKIQINAGVEALKKYTSHFNNVLYRAATEDKPLAYANKLIDDALALCGHPEYAFSGMNYCDEALAFLAGFED